LRRKIQPKQKRQEEAKEKVSSNADKEVDRNLLFGQKTRNERIKIKVEIPNQIEVTNGHQEVKGREVIRRPFEARHRQVHKDRPTEQVEGRDEHFA
jgi:hypothetical protein